MSSGVQDTDVEEEDKAGKGIYREWMKEYEPHPGYAWGL